MSRDPARDVPPAAPDTAEASGGEVAAAETGVAVTLPAAAAPPTNSDGTAPIVRGERSEPPPAPVVPQENARASSVRTTGRDSSAATSARLPSEQAVPPPTEAGKPAREKAPSAPAIADKTPVAVASSRTVGERETSDREATASAPIARPTPAPAPGYQRLAKLTLNARGADATVFLDGVALDQGLPIRNRDVVEGTHALRFVSAQGEEAQRSVAVSADKPLSCIADFEAAPPEVKCR